MAELSQEPNPLPVAAWLNFPGDSAEGRLSRFRCVGCGYGASCKIAPERCPMCGGATWEYEHRQWSADRDRPVGRESTL